MAYNPNFDVTQVNKRLPGLRGPKSAAPTAPAVEAPAVEEAPAQDVVVLGRSTETVVVETPAALPATVPPVVNELKERIQNLGGHQEDLMGRLQTAASALESGDNARGMRMLEAIQTYLELREDIRTTTGLTQNQKTALQQKAWQEFQTIAGQIDAGEDPAPFTTTRAALLNSRLTYYQGKQWGEGFTDFLDNVKDAIKNGNLEAAENLLQFCDTIFSARKAIKQLTKLIENPNLPPELRQLYTEARAQLRAEIRDIQSGNLATAQTHSQTAAGKLNQAQTLIARINTDHETQRQAQLTERGRYLFDTFSCDSGIYSQFQDQCPAEQLTQLNNLLDKIRQATESGQFNEDDIQALQDLQQLVSKMVARVDLQNFMGGIEQLQQYLAGAAQAQGTSGATQVAALRGAADGTAGFGPALTMLQHQAAESGQMGVTGLAALAHQQTLLQQLYALSRINTPEAKEAYNSALHELLDLNNCHSIRDLAMVLDNLVYLRQNGMLPPWLSTPQAQRNFLNQIKDHPLVQQALSDHERGQVVQTVESIAIVIVAAATAEIGGGLIAAELGIGGGAGGFLLTQAIVAPIFTTVNGGISQSLGLSEGWASPTAFAQEVAINYGMFVATGGAMSLFGSLVKAPTSVLGKIFYQGGSLLTEYMAFNGYSFALQAGEAAISDDLTMAYVFSGENVRNVFENNAVMLIGLKIGGFIAKPLLSPVREALLESANPQLVQDVRQYESKAVELTQRLGEFQEQGGEVGQYLDIRQDQLTSLENKVDLLTELREYGFATEAEVREAEAALVSARAEMEALTSQPIDERARIEVPNPGSGNGLPVVTADMVVPRSQLMQVTATYEGAQFELPSVRNGTAEIGGLTFRRVLFPAWEVSFGQGVESLTLHYTEHGVPQTANPVVADGQAFISCLGDGSVTLEIKYSDGMTRTIDIQRPVLSTAGIVSSYDLKALDNVDNLVAYQAPTEQAELFAQGARQQIWAKGMGGEGKFGLNNIVAAALDGEVRSGSMAFYGILSGDAQINNLSAGPHGPYYVVLDGQPTANNVGAEHQVAYLVPNSYAKGLFEASVREALDAHIITTAQAETILSKLYTQGEYVAQIQTPAFADTQAAGLIIKDNALFNDPQGFMEFLQDANSQFYDPASRTVAAEQWQAMQTHAAQLRAEYPGIPAYEAQALELVRARLSDLSPAERQGLIDIYGTDRPDIFFGDNYPDLKGLIADLETLMHTLGVGSDSALGQDMAMIKSRLVALDYTITERYASNIPISWWDGVSLDMADPFSYSISNIKESTGFVVMDTPALETYQVSFGGRTYNVELREVEYPADGHHDQVYFLVDAQSGETISRSFAQPTVEHYGNSKVIIVYNGQAEILVATKVSTAGESQPAQAANGEQPASASPDATNPGIKKRKKVTP